MFKITVDWPEFLAQYWQKKPVVLKNAFPNFQDPITPDELAGLSLEEEIESRLVTCFNREWNAEYGPFEDFSHLGDKEWSLLVQSVDHWHPTAAQLVKPFRQFPQWQFDDLMISYATPNGGVGPHIDNYDVFITQGMGKRNWKVGDRNPNYRQFSAHPALLHVEPYEPIIDVILETGDILYIPIGYPHHGVSLTESLSYSIGFRTPTTQELLSGFADYVLDSVPRGDFYQDPDLHFSDNPYQLQENEKAKLRSQMINFINNDSLFDRWIGIHLSQPNHGLNIIPMDPKFNLTELIENIDEETVLYKVAGNKILLNREVTYINGEPFNLPSKLSQALTENEALTGDLLLNHSEWIELILPLVNKGYLYFDDLMDYDDENDDEIDED